jgi:hypothetical protein
MLAAYGKAEGDGRMKTPNESASSFETLHALDFLLNHQSPLATLPPCLIA